MKTALRSIFNEKQIIPLLSVLKHEFKEYRINKSRLERLKIRLLGHCKSCSIKGACSTNYLYKDLIEAIEFYNLIRHESHKNKQESASYFWVKVSFSMRTKNVIRNYNHCLPAIWFRLRASDKLYKKLIVACLVTQIEDKKDE